ncbi:MAG: hypothetical protein ACTSQS_18200 [Promethearchaeota archaeon]
MLEFDVNYFNVNLKLAPISIMPRLLSTLTFLEPIHFFEFSLENNIIDIFHHFAIKFLIVHNYTLSISNSKNILPIFVQGEVLKRENVINLLIYQHSKLELLFSTLMKNENDLFLV